MSYSRLPGREAPAAEVATIAPTAVTRRDLTALIKDGMPDPTGARIPGEHAMRKLEKVRVSWNMGGKRKIAEAVKIMK